jgi:hypothetical protein
LETGFSAMKSLIPPPRKPDADSPRSPAGSGKAWNSFFDTLREVFQTTCKARGTLRAPRAGTPIDYDIYNKKHLRMLKNSLIIQKGQIAVKAMPTPSKEVNLWRP